MTHISRPRRASVAVAFTALALGFTSLEAQFGAPPGWKWVADRDVTISTALDPADGHWLFGTMAPGWHITTRPAVTVFEPAYRARGRFTVESETFLFPGASDAGFGVFVGGRDLESRGPLVAFLIRRDGSAAIESRSGSSATLLHPWTVHQAIVKGAATGDAVRNVLRVDGEATVLTFSVNGERVAEISRTADRADGIVGLRIGGDLNLHVTNLDLTHRLALPRPTKPGA